MVTFTVKLPPALASKLTAEARQKRVSKSALIRESMEQRYANGKARRRPTIGDLAGDLMGKLKGGPHDLSTNKKHMRASVPLRPRFLLDTGPLAACFDP